MFLLLVQGQHFEFRAWEIPEYIKTRQITETPMTCHMEKDYRIIVTNCSVGLQFQMNFFPFLCFLLHKLIKFHKYLLSGSAPVTVGVEIKEIQWFPQGCLKKKKKEAKII